MSIFQMIDLSIQIHLQRMIHSRMLFLHLLPPTRTTFFCRMLKGHECTICQDIHYLHDMALGTFRHRDGSRACQHVFCHTGLLQVRLIDGNIQCPTCRQTGEIVQHDIFPMPLGQRNFQDFLQQHQGHQCTICHEVHHLHNMALGTIQPNDISQTCRHVFCYTGLLRVRSMHNVLRCPSCRQIGHIVHHGIVERRA
jgi:hypothetical protein